MAPHVSWNGVFSDGMNKHDGSWKTERDGEKIVETYEGSLSSCRPPTTQGGIDVSGQRRPERRGNAPGID